MVSRKFTLASVLALAPALAAAQVGISPLKGFTKEEQPAVDRFNKITDELAPRSKECALDSWKLSIGILTGPRELLQASEAARRVYPDLAEWFRKEGIELRFGTSPELGEACKLSDEALRFNVGSAAMIRFLRLLVDMRAAGPAANKIDVLEIRLSPRTGLELYEANRAAEASKVGEKRTLVLEVNAGDYQVGLRLFDHFGKFFARR